MKLFALTIVHKSTSKAKLLKASNDLSSFGYFQRSSVKEFMDFTCKIVVERTASCSRSSVKEQEYMFHVFVRADGLSGVLISDSEYPPRVSFTLLSKVLDEFTAKYPASTWNSLVENQVEFKPCDEYLARYQNPKEADAMMKLQTDLDETKIILHDCLEGVLQRGENLDNLIEKSEGLSMQSKTFYKTAKKTNQCCVIL
ncbi:synaptobrevin homolog YKT6-like [Tubulanus polymorphus]|uniref:synaptobrevin homolog YKT6-like n=1 Tax=Tubulanus polymorphus TaxID=672921 RepID=UPI003DA3E595